MAFEITSSSLKALCRQEGLYSSVPALNEVLHLQRKGITKLQNLSEYTGLKTLYLENNAISDIEGLEALQQLSSLYLGRNIIRTITGLATLTRLETLDLSENDISHLQGLSCLPRLRTLTLSGNKLRTAASVQHLADCPALTSLDLASNRIDDADVLPILMAKPLLLLRLVGNPIVSSTRHYRKVLLTAMPSLNYLDDSPCFAHERRAAAAFMAGGPGAERAMRAQIAQEEEAERERHRTAFDDMVRRAQETAAAAAVAAEEQAADTAVAAEEQAAGAIAAAETQAASIIAAASEQAAGVVAAANDEAGGATSANGQAATAANAATQQTAAASAAATQQAAAASAAATQQAAAASVAATQQAAAASAMATEQAAAAATVANEQGAAAATAANEQGAEAAAAIRDSHQDAAQASAPQEWQEQGVEHLASHTPSGSDGCISSGLQCAANGFISDPLMPDVGHNASVSGVHATSNGLAACASDAAAAAVMRPGGDADAAGGGGGGSSSGAGPSESVRRKSKVWNSSWYRGLWEKAKEVGETCQNGDAPEAPQQPPPQQQHLAGQQQQQQPQQQSPEPLELANGLPATASSSSQRVTPRVPSLSSLHLALQRAIGSRDSPSASPITSGPSSHAAVDPAVERQSFDDADAADGGQLQPLPPQQQPRPPAASPGSSNNPAAAAAGGAFSPSAIDIPGHRDGEGMSTASRSLADSAINWPESRLRQLVRMEIDSAMGASPAASDDEGAYTQQRFNQTRHRQDSASSHMRRNREVDSDVDSDDVLLRLQRQGQQAAAVAAQTAASVSDQRRQQLELIEQLEQQQQQLSSARSGVGSLHASRRGSQQALAALDRTHSLRSQRSLRGPEAEQPSPRQSANNSVHGSATSLQTPRQHGGGAHHSTSHVRSPVTAGGTGNGGGRDFDDEMPSSTRRARRVRSAHSLGANLAHYSSAGALERRNVTYGFPADVASSARTLNPFLAAAAAAPPSGADTSWSGGNITSPEAHVSSGSSLLEQARSLLYQPPAAGLSTHFASPQAQAQASGSGAGAGGSSSAAVVDRSGNSSGAGLAGSPLDQARWLMKRHASQPLVWGGEHGTGGSSYSPSRGLLQPGGDPGWLLHGRASSTLEQARALVGAGGSSRVQDVNDWVGNTANLSPSSARSGGAHGGGYTAEPSSRGTGRRVLSIGLSPRGSGTPFASLQNLEQLQPGDFQQLQPGDPHSSDMLAQARAAVLGRTVSGSSDHSSMSCAISHSTIRSDADPYHILAGELHDADSLAAARAAVLGIHMEGSSCGSPDSRGAGPSSARRRTPRLALARSDSASELALQLRSSGGGSQDVSGTSPPILERLPPAVQPSSQAAAAGSSSS